MAARVNELTLAAVILKSLCLWNHEGYIRVGIYQAEASQFICNPRRLFLNQNDSEGLVQPWRKRRVNIFDFLFAFEVSHSAISFPTPSCSKLCLGLNDLRHSQIDRNQWKYLFRKLFWGWSLLALIVAPLQDQSIDRPTSCGGGFGVNIRPDLLQPFLQ